MDGIKKKTKARIQPHSLQTSPDKSWLRAARVDLDMAIFNVLILFMQIPEQLSTKFEKVINKSKKHPFNETKDMIRKLKTEIPVLATIQNYGGNNSVSDVLDVEKDEQKFQVRNIFGRILRNSRSNKTDRNARKNCVSFISYKHGSSHSPLIRQKLALPKRPIDSSPSIKFPRQLTNLKKKVLALPLIAQNCRRIQTDSDLLLSTGCGSPLLPNAGNGLEGPSAGSNSDLSHKVPKPFELVRSKHQLSSVLGSKKGGRRRVATLQNYSTEIKRIISQFSSPQLHTNEYMKACHEECVHLVRREQELKERYQRFENVGSPPKKIINLLDKLKVFEKNVDGILNGESAEEFSQVDSKRFNLILKHQQEIKRMNLQRFRQKNKQERIEDCRNALIESANNRGWHSIFKLNSQGKQVYFNNHKKHP